MRRTQKFLFFLSVNYLLYLLDLLVKNFFELTCHP